MAHVNCSLESLRQDQCPETPVRVVVAVALRSDRSQFVLALFFAHGRFLFAASHATRGRQCLSPLVGVHRRRHSAVATLRLRSWEVLT